MKVLVNELKPTVYDRLSFMSPTTRMVGGQCCDKGSISGHRHSRDIQRMHSLTKLTTTIYYLRLFTIYNYLPCTTIYHLQLFTRTRQPALFDKTDKKTI